MNDILKLLQKLAQLMDRADFSKMTQPERLEVMKAYRALSDPVDKVWRAALAWSGNQPYKFNPNIFKTKKLRRKKKR